VALTNPFKYRQAHENERGTPEMVNGVSLNAIRSLGTVLDAMLVRSDTAQRLSALGVPAYIDDAALVVPVSGDRSTGVTFRLSAGLGFERRAVPAAGLFDDLTTASALIPICVDDDAATFVSTVSHVANPRIDAVFVKPNALDANSQSVDVIDPNTDNITAESRNLDKRYSYSFAYVAGTPAGSPVAPAAPGGYTEAQRVANILIPPGSGAFDPGGLTDTRIQLELAPSLAPAVGALNADDVGVLAPLVDDHVQEALERLGAAIDALGAANARGILVHGGMVYKDTHTVTLQRGQGQGGTDAALIVEINGVIYTKTDADLDFDLLTHAEAAEAASTWYYLYLSASGSSLVPHLSATAPVLPGDAGRVGYHPSQPNWRWVGSIDRTVGVFFNDASSNIVPFLADRYEWRFRDAIPAAHVLFPVTLPSGANYNALALAGKVPPVAREVRLFGQVQGDDSAIALASGHLIGLAASTAAPIVLSTLTSSAQVVSDAAGYVALDGTQRIGYGYTPGSAAMTSLFITIAGWR
jgi:hypothetical protein